MSWNAPRVQKWNPNTMSYHQPLVRTVNSFCLAGDSLQPIIAWRVRRPQTQLMLRVDAALTSQVLWSLCTALLPKPNITAKNELRFFCSFSLWEGGYQVIRGSNHQHTGINIGAEDFNQAITVRGDNTENIIYFVGLWLQITHKRHECAVTVSTLMLEHSGELTDLTNWQLIQYTTQSIKKQQQ